MKNVTNLFLGMLLTVLFAMVGCDQDLGGLSAPTLTGTVTINGTANVGGELAAVFTPGEGQAAVDPLEKQYQWQGKTAEEDAEWENIDGEVNTAYKLAFGDQGRYIRVLVSVTGYRGSIAPETPSGPVVAAMDDGGGESGGDNEGENGGNGGGSQSYTAWVAFASGNNITGVTQSEIEDEGEAERTWTLDVVEEPLAVFAVQKQTGQTITVDGADAAKVRKADNGETLGAGSYKQIDETSGEAGDTNTYTGFTAGSTTDLFAVDMEDLLFDGNFGGEGHTGTETRTFTLTVAEAGKASRTVTVNLNITLDPDTETSIYHREGTPGAYRYEKVRDAALTAADKKNVAYPYDYDFTALTLGPVTDLQNAFVWVDKHGVGGGTIGSGAPAGYANGTTEGYSEYRLFLKKDQQIGKLILSFVNSKANNNKTESDTRDWFSIQLYGAGTSGTEKKITRNTEFVSEYGDDITLNYTNTKVDGFITLDRNTTVSSEYHKYKTLVLGKNITIYGGENYPVYLASYGGTSADKIQYFFTIVYNSTLIMEEGSKLTGYQVASGKDGYLIELKNTSSKFYMRGGTITGNEMGSVQGGSRIIKLNKPSNTGVVIQTGGTISGNSYNTLDNS